MSNEEKIQEESDPKESPVPNAEAGEGLETNEVSDPEEDDLGKNFQELENDPLERAQKEGGEEAEFDLVAQVAEFREQIEAEPDNCIHHYNLGEALGEMGEDTEAHVEFELALACRDLISNAYMTESGGSLSPIADSYTLDWAGSCDKNSRVKQ